MKAAGKYYISKELEKILKSKIRNYEPETVYHYTTIDGLKGIISKNELWLTERNFLNDIADENYIKEIVKDLLKTPGGIAFEGSFLDRYFIDRRPQYIFSSSIENDVAHQWLNYGKENPVCIEFYRQGLENIIDKFTKEEWKNGNHIFRDAFFSSPVLYEDENIDLINFFTTKYKDMLLKYTRDICPDENKRCKLESARSDFHLLYDSYKQKGFYAEQEYRFTIHSERSPEHRLRNDMSLPYLVLKAHKLPIKSIIIGPYNDDSNKDTVAEYLKKYNYEVVINLSKLNIRH